MISTTIKSAWARRRRLTGIFLAVFLGVSFLSGTLALGDTLSANFQTLFSSVTRGTDAVVRSTTSISSDRARASRPPIAASMAQTVRTVDGVARVEPSVEGYGALIGRDGKALGGNGPPRLAGNWITDPELNPYRLVEGRAPQSADEVVINRGAAKDGDLHVGDTTTVRTPDPVPVRVVGIATFGSEDGFGTATFTAFTLAAAEQRLEAKPGMVSSILVKAAPGVSQTELVHRLARVLPPGTQAVSGAQFTAENTAEVNRTFLNFLRTFLVVFAGIALLVAAFSIYNTFSIIAAQRTRESALLRAVGATRRQVLASVLAESLVAGAVASVAGLLGGVAIAGLLKGLFDAIGFALPAGGLVFKPSTVIIALSVGLGVTLVTGVAPALRASRVRPLAALRDAAAESARVPRARVVAGLLLGGAGVATVLAAVVGGSGNALPLAGLGAFVTIVGVVVFGPVVAGPLTTVVGAPLGRLRGMSAAMARRNAARNPRRTSATAAALLVGVAVVTLFTTFGASIKASLDDSVKKSFGGDLVVNGGRFGRGSLSPRMAPDIARLPEVQTAVGLGAGGAKVAGDDERLTIVEPAALTKVLDVDVMSGSLATLGRSQLAVGKTLAGDHGWKVGTALPVTFADGTSDVFTVGAVYKNTDVVSDIVVTRAAWAPHAVQDADDAVLIALRPGISLAAGKTAVEQVAGAYGGPTVQDRQEYVASVAQGVNMILGLIYVLLFLAIVIAAMGIANTLSLSIYERTRELGVLRAVGQTRGQLRSMVRWESVIVSTFGALGGLGVGVFLGWALVKAVSAAENVGVFAVPGGQLAVILVLGAVVGVLAALRPARRAARMDVLAAVAAQ